MDISQFAEHNFGNRQHKPDLNKQFLHMRKLGSKLIYLLGLFTLFLSMYMLTFFFALNKIVGPYERANYSKPHPFRPAYNVLFYPMRKFIANGSSFKPEKIKQYYGTLKRPYVTGGFDARHRSVRIKTPEETDVVIGFTGKRSTLDEFDKIEFESYVRFVFGTALSKDHDRFINRLISIEVIDLVDDPRIEDEAFSPDEEQRISVAYSGLRGTAKECASKFVTEYKDSVLEHCLLAGYASNVGGGCFHLYVSWHTTTVEKHALEKCNLEY